MPSHGGECYFQACLDWRELWLREFRTMQLSVVSVASVIYRERPKKGVRGDPASFKPDLLRIQRIGSDRPPCWSLVHTTIQPAGRLAATVTLTAATVAPGRSMGLGKPSPKASAKAL